MEEQPQIINPNDDPETLSWSLFGVWNKALEERSSREIQPRDRIWASELGGSYVDRYLRMMGVVPTNPPNARSLRKFDMGNFYELFLRVLLMKADLFQKTQEYVVHKYPDLLDVTGRLDFLAGGKPNFDKAREYVEEWAELTGEKPEPTSPYAPRWYEISHNFVKSLEETFSGKILKPIIIEAKTCSSFMFDRYEMTKKPNPHHALQLYHYLIGKGMPEGHIFYLCKDDGRAIEFGVFNPSPIEEIYKQDIENMTHYYRNGVQPDLEPLILFDPETAKFQKNWKVEYSNYLYQLYGFETPMDYREQVDSYIRGFNNLINRIAAEKPLTKGNQQALDNVPKYFPQFDDLVIIAKDVMAKKKLLGDQEVDESQEKDESIV